MKTTTHTARRTKPSKKSAQPKPGKPGVKFHNTGRLKAKKVAPKKREPRQWNPVQEALISLALENSLDPIADAIYESDFETELHMTCNERPARRLYFWLNLCDDGFDDDEKMPDVFALSNTKILAAMRGYFRRMTNRFQAVLNKLSALRPSKLQFVVHVVKDAADGSVLYYSPDHVSKGNESVRFGRPVTVSLEDHSFEECEQLVREHGDRPVWPKLPEGKQESDCVGTVDQTIGCLMCGRKNPKLPVRQL